MLTSQNWLARAGGESVNMVKVPKSVTHFPILNYIINHRVPPDRAVLQAMEKIAFDASPSLWRIQNVADIVAANLGNSRQIFDVHETPCRAPLPAIWTSFELSGQHWEVVCSSIGNTTQMYVAWNPSPGEVDHIPLFAHIEFGEDGSVVDSTMQDPDHLSQEEWDGFYAPYVNVSAVALFAFAFSHCKNVELVERLPKRHEQREAKRRGEPILKYHEIVIDPGKTKQVAVGAGSASQDHPSRALHIARGHFATYTEDKPLFGKYTGTFWRPAHIRGSAELGAVKSTYKVKAG